MKRILITGKKSYIGLSIKKWLEQWPEKYIVDTVGTRNKEWEQLNFSIYDTVIHVAGIAHQDTKRDQKSIYYKVNRDLTIDIAIKAKKEGVSQFIFMSSMIVYGESSKINEEKIINRETVPHPLNFYGDSKLQAEKGILPLTSDQFHVVILRPPMVYGENSKGNYQTLSKFSNKFFVFPNISNKRSMIYIEHLAYFVQLMLDNDEAGIFFPQNEEYVKTAEMVRLIAKTQGRTIYLTKIFNPIIKLFANSNLIKKVFGNLCYSHELSQYKEKYSLYTLGETIEKTEVRD